MRKITALLLGCLMLAGVSACKKDENAGANVVTFNAVIDTDLEILFDAFANQDIDEDIYDNRWTRLYKEKLGIEVKYNWVALGWDQKLQKQNLDMTSGNIADVVTFEQVATAREAYEEGLTIDLRDYMDRFSPLVREQIESESTKVMLGHCTADDGAVFAIPGFTNMLNQSPILYLRKDWLNNVGLDEPKNRDDVLNIIRAFANNDPNRSGKKDTYGIGLVGNFIQYQGELNSFTEMFGGFAYDWVKGGDGKIAYGGISEGTKDGLEALGQLYRDGCIDPSFSNKDCNKVVEDLAAGKLGMIYAPLWLVENGLHANWLKEKNAEWAYYPVFGEDGIATVHADAFARNYIAISSEFERPEIVIDMINLYFETVFGGNNELSKHYYMDEEYANYWHLSPIQFVDSRNYGCTVNYREVMRMLDGSLKYEDAQYMSQIVYDVYQKYLEGKTYANGGLTLGEWKKLNTYGPFGTTSVLAKYEDEKCYTTSYSYLPEAEVTYGALQTTTFTGIIKNAYSGSLDTVWDNYVSQWRSKGGDKQTEEYNQWFAKRFS